MKLFLAFLLSGSALLAGCKATTPTEPATSTTATPASVTASPPSSTTTPPATPTDVVDPTEVTIYKADSECVNFQPQQVTVPGDRAMEAAVGEVLKTYSNPDFDLSGYRVAVQDGVATVDLRLPADSPRQITSLSACEQFALFGSLRETLTKNPDWQVKSVRFMERGEEIAL